mmetsp:Transcript_5863/g.13374  ORF Transcript_5863/g.13374 Transcript_5863/m.13374 type:complete len:296 (+) Transcript_5863:252-1139(+)
MATSISKRRARPNRAVTTAVVVAAMTTAMATRMSASAFMAVDTTTPSFSSSLVRPQPVVKFSSTNLFATDGDASDEKKKLTIETITDDNSQILLHPPSSPDRPILVDAFAPWCGPCKLLDKVLRKAQPNYLGKVDFCRWNVNDKENTVELKKIFLDSGFTLTKLPSIIVFREGKPVAVRAGFANEFQLDDFLEKTLPDVLERTFDENGIKMIPLPKEMMMLQEEKKETVEESKAVPETAMASSRSTTTTVQHAEEKVLEDDCTDPVECWERVEQTVWQNRRVVPAMDGILLPVRS